MGPPLRFALHPSLERDASVTWEVSGCYLTLKTPEEQLALLAAWERVLHALPVPCQVLCRSERFEPRAWYLRVPDADYEALLQQQDGHLIKRLYLVVRARDALLLSDHVAQLTPLLQRLGLRVRPVTWETVTPPWHMRARHLWVNEGYHASLAVVDWPHRVLPGFLSTLINLDKAVDVSFFIYPEATPSALRRLNRAIAQREATVVLKDESNNYQEDLDAELESALLMREELYQHEGRCFQLGCYLTLRAPSLPLLKQDLRSVATLLRGHMIATRPLWLRQDEAYVATQPFGYDPLRVTYGLTTTPLLRFFPFLASTLTDEGGVMLGRNLLNNSPLLLNLFGYTHASMVVMGKNGAGKSFTVKALVDKLLKQGVRVTVLDREGEYRPLARVAPGLEVVNHGQHLPAYRDFLQRYVASVERDYHQQRSCPRLLVVDEFWFFLQDPVCAALLQDIAKTGRKRWLALCALTQEVEDLLQHPTSRSLINNATFKVLMRMEVNQRQLVQTTFGLTEHEYRALTVAEEGEGLLMLNGDRWRFQTVVTPYLYTLLTTKPEEVLIHGPGTGAARALPVGERP